MIEIKRGIKVNGNQKGITLISLIVTIIVMSILLAVTANVGNNSYENSKMVGFVTYMQAIQKKVDIVSVNEDYSKYGSELSNLNKEALTQILRSDNETFYTTVDSEYLRYFNREQIANDLELENVKDEIVIDFNTREIISLRGIKYNGEMYYTQYNLPMGQKLIQKTEEANRNVELGSITANIEGLNATFTINNVSIFNGTLSYGKRNSNDEIVWTTITNHTKNGENVTTSNITESGTYYFKLQDNTTGKDNIDEDGEYPSIELRLSNAPKLQENLTDLTEDYNYSNINKSEEWAYATDRTDENNMKHYVWIPRFAYKLNESKKLEELQFLRGNSNVATNNEYINTTEWTIPSAFGEKTGVWVNVNLGVQSRYRYN